METKRDWRILVGRSGSGKSGILHQLLAEGHQVLDLEAVAGMRGACVAPLFGRSVVSQEEFRRRLQKALVDFDPAYPVWTEWKGHRVGVLKLPRPLFGELLGGEFY